MIVSHWLCATSLYMQNWESNLWEELTLLHNTSQVIFLLSLLMIWLHISTWLLNVWLFLSSLGLTHIIETRKVLDLRINLKPSYLIVPQTGFHHKKSNLLILDFGTFQVGIYALLSAKFCSAWASYLIVCCFSLRVHLN